MKISRHFTHASTDAYDLIHFREREAMGDSFDTPLAHPDNWSREAVELLAEDAACSAVPTVKPVEENTVPSWLWRQSVKLQNQTEGSVSVIFDRVVGAAAYTGWKQKLFANEDSARAFYDEARYALAQRFMAIEPKYLSGLGLDWAYGVAPLQQTQQKNAEATTIAITNAMIDTVVSGSRDRATLNAWHKVIGARTKASTLALRFADTTSEWEAPALQTPMAALNLLAFRHNDGTINIDALRQATRLMVLLLDLHGVSSALSIGHVNLAPLLMALGLPYDSEAGRTTAAAISAIITAEAFAVSAELAAQRGAAPDFSATREATIRALRNHRRAAYDEQTDYEKISVIPSPLSLKNCADLALGAAARSGWDRALELAQAHGLRHTQVTSLVPSPTLTLFMESVSDGIAPMRVLTAAQNEATPQRSLHPSVAEALARLGYPAERVMVITHNLCGHASLAHAPTINHVSLRAHSFTKEVLTKIEAYLPQAQSLRYAVTPWIVGVDFCRKVLKIPAAKIEAPDFNLLSHLGFDEKSIQTANAWVYGRDTLDAALVKPEHAKLFATAASLPPEAHIRMAAAVQGFVSGEAGLNLALPVGMAAERVEKLLLDAWRRGVKTANLTFDATLRSETPQTAAPKLRRKTAAFIHAKAPALPKRISRSAASAPRLGKGKTRGVTKAQHH